MMVRRVGMVAVFVCGVVACSGNRDAAQGTQAARTAHFVELPHGPWTELAQRLVAAPDLGDAVTTTREVLARGGVGTWDGQRMLVTPRSPASGFRATPLETVHLAMEARNKPTMARMDTAELAQMLQAFGWPFKNANPMRAADKPRLGDVDREDVNAVAEANRLASNAERAAQMAAKDAERDELAALRNTMVEPAKVESDRARAAQVQANDASRNASAADRPAARERLRLAQAELSAAGRTYYLAREQFKTIQKQREEESREATKQRRLEEDIARRIGPNYKAGEQLMEFLATWINDAAKHPEDPRSFTPLFLAEMARLQSTPVDLTGDQHVSPTLPENLQPPVRGAPRATQMRWTLLELELFAAAFHRPEPATAMRGPVDEMSRIAGAMGELLVPAAHAGTPCSDMKSSLGPDRGEVDQVFWSQSISVYIEQNLKYHYGKETADAVGRAMSAASLLGKVIKLAAFYANNEVTVEANPKIMHKAVSGFTPVTYIATAGVDAEALKAYEQMEKDMSSIDQEVRDCMGWAGLPTMDTISETAKDAENWLIDWSLVEGAPPHAVWSPRDNDFYLQGVRQATKMQRVSPSSAQAKYVARVLPEKGHTGPTRRARVTARAEVDAAGMPSLGLLISAARGGWGLGLVDSLAEIASGWVMVAFKPKAYASIEVEYHCPNPTTRHLYASNPLADGGGDGGKSCTFEFQSKEEFEKWHTDQK